MIIKRCKCCGEPLSDNYKRINQKGEEIFNCIYCGTDNYDIEKTTPEKKEYENDVKEVYHLLNNLKYEEAEEKIDFIKDRFDNKEDYLGELNFLLVLARNGVCYVKDYKNDSKRYIATLNSVSFKPIMDSEYAKKAMNLEIDEEKKTKYQKEFDYIEKIRSGIVSEYNNPDNQCDIFISFKDTAIDQNGNPIVDVNGEKLKTKDYEIAYQIYTKLKEVEPNFKVFFSPISLKEKAGVDYEKYIFTALNKAKVFILVGTNIKHIEWPWVKNEWKRYLNLINNSELNKNPDSFLLVYSHMNIHDLPNQIQSRQAISLSNNLNAFDEILSSVRKICFLEDVEIKSIQNNNEMLLELGDKYFYGLNGKIKNVNKAIVIYELAASKGNVSAKVNLGNLYFYGREVSKDYKKAFKYYLQGAECGDMYAQFNLGQCYENGRGIEQNITKAKYWYNLAAKQGHFKAKEKITM